MNQELINEFLLESFENLISVTEEITYLEKNQKTDETINSIFRKIHTLKGSAGFLGFKKLQSVAHAAETLLDLVREKTIPVSSMLCDILLESIDAFSEILKNIEISQKEPEKSYSTIISKLDDMTKNKAPSAIPEERNIFSGTKIPSQLLEEDPVVKVAQVKQVPVVEVAEVKKEVIQMEKPKEVQAQESNAAETHENSAGKNLTDSVVRVNVQLLDKIMNVVGELVLSRNQILQFANTQDTSELTRLAQQLNTITSELQADIMSTRMQPVGSVLSKFERIVRDLAKSQEKKIKLELIGKETELDKTLLEAIRDPLTHLIRNSVDHGIENSEMRKQRGKTEEGKIVIRSFHESGQVSIEISDDGNGIDPQKISAKAIQKKILTQEQVNGMSAKQILQIIFMPGFSTAEQVTNISGRGVGMDVVKSNVEKIGGSVDVHSEVGKGSTFKLKIPLTLAIVPALVVQDKGETFAIPQVSLVELVRFDNSQNNIKIEKLYGSEFFRLRGDLIPVFRLSQTLGLTGNKSMSELIADEVINVVVLSAEGRTYGLIVDLILDTEEIVVKPLSKELKNLTFYAGATIMGDGNVSLILDAIGFYHYAEKGHGQKIDRVKRDVEVEIQKAGDTQEFLLCELGDKRQYAIPLLLVNRLEEFKTERIDWSGDQALIKYGDYPMPLINLENFLKLKGESAITEHTERELLNCVVIKVREHLYGLVVNEINDIQVTESVIHSESIDRAGMLGTVFIKDHSVTVLDLHTILEGQGFARSSKSASSKKKSGKVLMVEDSPLYQKIQRDFLEETGLEVLTAGNGKEALHILDLEDDIKIIVTDIEMPIMNGWELSEEVRCSTGKFRNIPIVAVTSKTSASDKDRSVKCGQNEYLEKLNKVDLQKVILKLVG